MPALSTLYGNSRPRSTGGSSPPSPILTPSDLTPCDTRKALHPRADESEDGYSTHPSIYSASPVGSSDSECGRTVYGVADASRVQLDTGVFAQEVEDADIDQGRDGGRRNSSSSSGLSMPDTASERKSVSSSVVLGTDVDASGDEEFCGDEYSTDDEFGYEYGRPFYYEYTSPTQPLHPARSRSAPPRGEVLFLRLFGVSWNFCWCVGMSARCYSCKPRRKQVDSITRFGPGPGRHRSVGKQPFCLPGIPYHR